MASVLVVDDNPGALHLVRTVLTSEGHGVVEAHSGAQAVARARDGPFDLVLLELRLPDIDGLGLSEALRSGRPQLIVVILTSHGSVASAVQCLKVGVADYLEKPLDPPVLATVVNRLLAMSRPRPIAGLSFDGMVGTTPAMQRLFEQIRTIAPLDVPVLIQGETGTGKELVARSLHARSGRSGRAFVDVNCSAVPIALFESEFFGHERGAFTGAGHVRHGRFEQADGGTLFLDEVADLPPEGQPKLLRALERKQIVRLGGSRPIGADVRLVCATNRDVRDAIEQGTFREDLYWRLSGATFSVPPLRERRQDIPLLAAHLLEVVCERFNRGLATLAPDALDALTGHDWPGNVRELEHVVCGALLSARGSRIEAADLPAVAPPDSHRSGSALRFSPDGLNLRWNTDRFVQRLERHLITAALSSRGTHAGAARALGIDPKTLYEKKRRHGIAN